MNIKKRKRRQSISNIVYYLLTTELLWYSRHVIVILGLVHVAGNRRTKAVLVGELLDWEVESRVPCVISNAFFAGDVDLARLLVDEQHVAVQTSALGRARAYVSRQGVALLNIAARHVHHEPVLEFAHLRILSARCIWVCEKKNNIVSRWRQLYNVCL